MSDEPAALENETSNDYVTSAITVNVPEFNERYVDKKVVTFYTVEVTNHFSKQSWKLEKRYKEFENLHKELGKLLSGIAPIPKKTMFKVSSFEDLTKRRLTLQEFLRDCITRKDVLSSNPFKEFLELEKHSPELSSNAPEIIGKLEDIPLGVRDFYYSRENGVIFMCCSDMNIVSRADSLLGNIKFPWEKDNSHIAVGAAIIYRTEKIGGEYKFARGWAKSFPIQTGVIEWCPEGNVFSVGLDDGTIYLYTHDIKTNYNHFDELIKIKPHKDRVMGISFEYNSGRCYSCSKDKSFMVSDTNAVTDGFLICHSHYGFTNLHNDKDNQRIFLTNEGGELYVFMTNKFPPDRVCQIKTISGGCIRGFHLDLKKELIFTTNTAGAITVIDVGDPGRESTIREISNFGFKAKFRLIRYDSELNQVMTGDQNGRVTIWNLKTGKSIYAWSAHPKEAITQMYFENSQRILWTGGKDKRLIAWQLPEKWENEEIEKFEANELKNINDQLAKEKMQKTLQRRLENEDSSDSDDDDLNGWDYREY